MTKKYEAQPLSINGGSALLNAKAALRTIMRQLEWDKPDMQDTPLRWLNALVELTNRQRRDFTFTTFESRHDQIVVVPDIPFHTLCAHHLLPFFGRVHIAYIPNGKIGGASKFPRLVEWLACGAWDQESFTEAIADEIEEVLSPAGLAVIPNDVQHTCMTIRGVETHGTHMITSVMRGAFQDHSRTAKAELMALLSMRSRL